MSTVLGQKAILYCLCLPSLFSNEFLQQCVCARLNLGYRVQLCVGLSLPRHYVEGSVPPKDNLLN